MKGNIIDIDEKLWKHMKDGIKMAYYEQGYNFESEHFLNVIWNVSTEQLPGLEVSVVIDRNDKLFIGKGTGSWVDYEDESVSGMQIPLKCWIHTHPFGAAYFSGTDWRTINTQKPILDKAIVLGNMERMSWHKESEREKLCRTEMVWIDEEE